MDTWQHSNGVMNQEFWSLIKPQESSRPPQSVADYSFLRYINHMEGSTPALQMLAGLLNQNLCCYQ